MQAAPTKSMMMRTHFLGAALAFPRLWGVVRDGWGQARVTLEVMGIYLIVFGCKLGWP